MDAQSKKHIATSRWMTPDEVEQRFVHRDNSFWMGRNATNSEEGVGFSDDRHIMLVSGSRGGKGVSVIVPNLCLWQGSLVVVDPKGENATLTAARRGQGSANCTGLGQAVHVLDPMNVARVDDAYRASFNPLDALDPSSPHVIDDATRIADAIVEIGQGESRQWDEGARSLVRTLVLHVLTHPHYEGRRNLVTVRRLILQGENAMADELRERAKQRGEGSSPSGQVVLWELARRNDALNGVISSSADSFLESAKNSPKQYNSYRLIAERSTEFLDSPGMATCVSSSSFRLADLKTDANGVSVYLALPQRFMSTHYRWLRMMIALTVTEMETVPGQPASGARVLMVLDEFAGLRRMDIIENGVAQIAGFGVKMFFVLQSLEQLKSVYPDRWETFLANCGIRIFFATTDNFTNQYVSDALGEHEIVRTTRSTGRSTTDTSSTSDSFGETTSEQISTAKTRGDSSTTGRGGNTSKSRGGNDSRSQGTGTSESGSTGYGPEWFFAERTGRQSGEGSSTNRGSSFGKSWSDGMGRNWSRSKTRTSSTTRTQGTTTGTSRTSQTGTSQALGKNFGQSEQIFKKALITKDEMAKLFTRIDDPNHRAYPGLALINIAGEAPMLLRRTPYYSDPAFIELFDPHPDHPFLPYTPPPKIDPPKNPIADFRAPIYNPKIQLSAKEASQLSLVRELHQFIFSDTYSVSATIPYPLKYVWSVLTNLQYIPRWCFGANQSTFSASEFTVGTDFGSGFISSVDPEVRLGFRLYSITWCDVEVKISKRGENFTNVKLTQYELPEQGFFKKALFTYFMLKRNKADVHESQKAILSKQIQNLSNACFDIINIGEPEDAFSSSNRYVTYRHSVMPGIFHADVNLDDLLGQHVDITEFENNAFIIGHVTYRDSKGNEQSHECYLPSSGVITQIFKTDGDIVNPNERILMIDPGN